VKRVALVLTFVTLAFPRMTPAQGPAPAPPDTIRAGSRGKLETQYSGGIKGDVNQVSMGNRLSATLSLARGIMSVTSLNADDSEYRIEDRSIINKSFTSTLLYPAAPGLMLNGGISDARSFNSLVTSTGQRQDFVNNTQRADANANYARLLGKGVSVTGSALATAARSEQTFETNKTREGEAAAGIRYGLGRMLEATARGYFHLDAQESESGGRRFTGLGASADSVVARARLVVRDSSVVTADYTRFTSKRDYLDIPRTSQGGLAISDTVQVTPEEESRDVKGASINAETKPFSGLKLTLRAEHSDAATYFAQARQRTGRDTGDLVSGTVTYTPGRRTSFTFDFKKRSTFRWQGPERTGHYDDTDKTMGLGWNQTLTGTLRFTAKAGASLARTVYVDPDQNGDRDQRYVYANVRLNSKLVPKVDASVYVNVARTDVVKIRASQSANNRQETLYELRPEFTYKITNRIDLTQRYGLNIQFADYVFQENENFLDRVLSFSNLLRTRLSTKLGVDFYYALQRHDKGSYLRPEPEAERVLVVNQEERRDEVKISFRYQINRHLTLLGANDYSQRKDLLAPPERSAVLKNGGVEIGIDGSYDFGGQRSLKLAMKRVKRFGRFNAEGQNDYWVMDSSINYKF
jgi:hypothetical protein